MGVVKKEDYNLKVKWIFCCLLILITFIITGCNNQGKEIKEISVNNGKDNSTSDLEKNKNNTKIEDSDKPTQGINNILDYNFTLEDIKKFILEADALVSKLYEGDIYSSSKLLDVKIEPVYMNILGGTILLIK